MVADRGVRGEREWVVALVVAGLRGEILQKGCYEWEMRRQKG